MPPEPPKRRKSFIINPTTASVCTTILLALSILIAFSPSLFYILWSTPLYYLSPSRASEHPSQDSSSPYANYINLKFLHFPTFPSSPFPNYGPVMSWSQKQFTLPSKSRGSYLITDTVIKEVPEIKNYKVGILNLFIQHTSCALSLNENYDSDVREDMSEALDRIAPEDKKGVLYRHSAEGLDDMPAHIKSALIGASVSIPITNGRLATGTWQGIWYLEFRAQKHSRKIVATIQGEKM